MGYTHYWNINPEANEARYKKALKDCVKIVEHGTKKGILAGWDGKGKPEIKNGLSFNGKAPKDYESFTLPGKPMDVLKGDFVQKDKDGYVFNFCKTAQRPYDIYVTACLATMRSHLGRDFKISSDGGEEAFKEGQEFADQILGKNVLSRKKNSSKETVLYEWGMVEMLPNQHAIVLSDKSKWLNQHEQYLAIIRYSDAYIFNCEVHGPKISPLYHSTKNLKEAVEFCEKELINAFNHDPENKNNKIMISSKLYDA